MNLLQAAVLGLIQGFTEFIPVSSSGHLVLLHEALGVTGTGLTFDVALHLGTLIALIIFFWKELTALAISLFQKTKYTSLARLLLLATIPAVIAGVLLEGLAETAFRSPVLVAVNLAVFGVIMLAAERYARRIQPKTKLKSTRTGQALAMGFAQALAIVPGVSRSGSTITAGLFAGMDRVAATKFSFLLGVPIITGASAKVLLEDSAVSQIGAEPAIFIVGITTAFLAGLLAIKFLLGYLAKHSLAVFAYYRLGLAALTLVILLIV